MNDNRQNSGNNINRDIQLKKIVFMMRLLYLSLVLLSLVIVGVTGFQYLGGGLEEVEQPILLLIGMMTLLLLFNGYFVFRDSSLFQHLNSQIAIKDESYRNIEALNLELRAQRHDFLNHIQILYSLMELGAYEDTTAYLNRLYGDVGRLSANIKTGSVAFNALLQAKANEAESLGVTYETTINSRLDDLNMPDWELCRVIGNMIDNGFRASLKTEVPAVGVVITENITDYKLVITNTSMEIDPESIDAFFAPGFTTKKEREGHGMGLYISRQLMNKYGNAIDMVYEKGRVMITVTVHKSGLEDRTSEA